jgi:hypothetical protein
MNVVPFQPSTVIGRPSWMDVKDKGEELAELIANTEFVPRGLRGNQPAIAACILYGHEVGLGPMQSLAKIAVIDGRPTLSAEAQRALILHAGHELWIEESTNARAVIAGRRRGDKNTSRVTWTLDDAKRAGIAGRRNWQTYPRQMLLARASAELARAIFADAIGGLAATEEFEAETAPGEGPEVVTETPPTTTRRRRRPAPAPAPAPDPPTPESIAAPPDPATPAQLRAVMADFRELGLADDDARDTRLAWSSEVIGRPLTSSRDLTTVEASQLLEALKTRREAAVEAAVVEELDATEVTPEPSRFPIPESVQQTLDAGTARPRDDDRDNDFPPGF